MDKTSLGDRMKEYESTTKTTLLRRTPTIIRVDGKAFHTWTKYLSPGVDPSIKQGPFSEVMHKAMTSAMLYAVDEMQNVRLGYTQSDEISFLLNDWETIDTQQWFGGGIQKIASVTAATVTAGFIKALYTLCPVLMVDAKYPTFDARVFQLPKEEVTNYFLWRQQDASRNSVQMLGRFFFSHKDLHRKNVSNIQDMLMLDHGVNWNDLDTWKKRGTCAVRKTERIATNWKNVDGEPNTVTDVERSKIVLDEEIPIFTQDRDYVERHL